MVISETSFDFGVRLTLTSEEKCEVQAQVFNSILCLFGAVK
jgi:hypothetical protein